jgi:hypothetical protein
MTTAKEERALRIDHAHDHVTMAQEHEDPRQTKEHDAAAFQRMREQYEAASPLTRKRRSSATSNEQA